MFEIGTPELPAFYGNTNCLYVFNVAVKNTRNLARGAVATGKCLQTASDRAGDGRAPTTP